MGAITTKLEISSKPRKDGRSIIMLRLTHNRKMKRVSTTVYVFPRDFNVKATYGSWIRKSDPQHVGKNRTLQEWVYKAEAASMELSRKGQVPTLEKVKELITIEENSDFISYWKKVVDRIQDEGRIGTYKKYNNGYEKMKKYIGSRKFGFHDLTVSFLKDYRTHLKKIGNNHNTVIKEMKVIRAVLYRAISEGLFPQEHNPFFKLKISNEKGNKAKLGIEEVKRMEELQLEPNSFIWHVRNFWLFSMYCAGIRFSDVCRLRWENISNGRLNYQMAKTEVSKSIVLLPQALKILEFYKSNSEHNMLIFPLLKESDFTSPDILFKRISSKNALVNKTLKQIAKKAKINEKLSFHVSRHTFADIARKKIGSKYGIYEVSKMLGHSSIKVTETYLNSFDQESVDEAMTSIFE